MSRDKRQEEKKQAEERDQPITLIMIIGLTTAALIALLIWGSPPQAPTPKPHPQSTPPSQPKPDPKPDPKPAPQADLIPTEELPPEKLDPIAIKGLEARVTRPTQTPERRARELPRELNLREHTVMMRGGEAQLRVTVSLSADDPQVIMRAAPLRGRLISMLYFLISHRVPESMRVASGEERLRRDLHERFSNLLRRDDFELHFDGLSLEDVELPDE